MEGHRGEPRNKPPFPGIYGLWGRPTLMNSVETFAHVPIILERGADWWRSRARAARAEVLRGLGPCRAPGVYCVPMGTTVRELIELAGGVSGRREAAGAFQPGGASSNFLGPDTSTCRWTSSRWPTPVDAGLRAVGVMAEGTDLLAAGTNVLRFFRNESCGKCVPVPGRVEARRTTSSPGHRAGSGAVRVRRAAPPSWSEHSADLDLRPGPGRAGPRGQRARPRARRRGRPAAATLARHRIPGRRGATMGVLMRRVLTGDEQVAGVVCGRPRVARRRAAAAAR